MEMLVSGVLVQLKIKINNVINMKAIILSVLFILLSILNSNSQSYQSFSNEISISLAPSLSEKIENAVMQKLKAWVQKDQFEKTEDFEKRVSKERIAQQQVIFTQLVINNIADSMINWKECTMDYDPDHETYKIKGKNLNPFLLKVPSGEEAISFKEGVNDLIFMSPKFTLSGNETFVLLEVEIKNPLSDHTYVLDKNVQEYTTSQLIVNIDKVNLQIPSGQGQQINETVNTINVGHSDVDINLPKTKTVNENSYAVVIGNKDYTNLKNKNVDFAINDALMIKKYLMDVMGYKEGNIIYKPNAAKGDFESIFGNKENYKGDLYNLANNPEAEIFIYYSGHGAPSQYTKKSYLVPIECKPNNIDLGGYPTELLYSNLGKIKSKFTTVIIDACYSGNIYENISPLGIPVDEMQVDIPNGIVITATSSNQTANWYPDQQHGLFTYYFLKAIQNKDFSDKNKDGNLTIDELYSTINDNNSGIPYYARLIGQQQNPNIKGNGKSKVLVKY